MTRQNRVLPTGEIVALPFRGTLTGNRGVLHDAEGRLGRARWRHGSWIACLLAFKGRHRAVMTPGRWTELFFLDEAVALAAGHRPCAECRRADHRRYKAAWAEATGAAPSAPDMDAALHAARIDPATRAQRTFTARTADLPGGTFVRDRAGAPALLWDGRTHAYRLDRYGAPQEAPDVATVLTPAPTVAALRHGYRPAVLLA